MPPDSTMMICDPVIRHAGPDNLVNFHSDRSLRWILSTSGLWNNILSNYCLRFELSKWGLFLEKKNLWVNNFVTTDVLYISSSMLKLILKDAFYFIHQRSIIIILRSCKRLKNMCAFHFAIDILHSNCQLKLYKHV